MLTEKKLGTFNELFLYQNWLSIILLYLIVFNIYESKIFLVGYLSFKMDVVIYYNCQI